MPPNAIAAVPGPTAPPTLAAIIATIGPASEAPETVAKLIGAGVAIFRINFSHGTFDDHARRLAVIRDAARRLGVPIAVLGDLPGPKIRIGPMPEGGLTIETGQDVLIDPQCPLGMQSAAGAVTLSCRYARIAAEVQPGQRVLINDGALRLLALPAEPGDSPTGLRCRVTSGGLVTSGKGINLPDSELSVPAVTEQDIAFTRWALEHALDYLALSFVRTAAEVVSLRATIAALHAELKLDVLINPYPPIIAKIEKPQAVANIESIASAADALMVARGDLGVEMDIAEVPMVQKRIVAAAEAWGKPCIVATQMLESMISAPSPTRAEATDVANAVLDGADCVMLSGETAVGKYPVLTVETMRRIIHVTERSLPARAAPTPPAKVVETGYRTAAIAHGAWWVARDVKAKFVVVWSQAGGGARYLSQTGFAIPIIAYSSSPVSLQRMNLLKGVRPLFCPVPAADTDSLARWNERVEADLLSRGWIKPGEAIVLMAGRPLGTRAPSSTLAVCIVGDATTGFCGHC